MEKSITLLLSIFLLNIVAFAQQYELFGIIGKHFVRIDIQTGQAFSIGVLDSTHMPYRHMTYDPYEDKIYAISDPAGNPKLVTIDRYSLHVQNIGLIDAINPTTDLDLVEALSFNSVDSVLYACGHESPSNTSSSRIMVVDTITANATIISNLSATCQSNSDADALVFYNGGAYVLDRCASTTRFYTLDVFTGIVSFIGASNQLTGGGLAVDPLSGVFYGINYFTRRLYLISSVNGNATLIGSTHQSTDFDGEGISALVFAPVTPLPVGQKVFLKGDQIDDQYVKLNIRSRLSLEGGTLELFRQRKGEENEVIYSHTFGDNLVRTHTWTYVDRSPYKGNQIYKIRFTDLLGTETMSNQLEILTDNLRYDIFPNPVSDILRLEGILAEHTMIIYDTNGVLVRKHRVVNSELDLSELPNGLYYLLLIKSESGEIVLQEKLIKY